jgi:hypothetical protein
MWHCKTWPRFLLSFLCHFLCSPTFMGHTFMTVPQPIVEAARALRRRAC